MAKMLMKKSILTKLNLIKKSSYVKYKRSGELSQRIHIKTI